MSLKVSQLTKKYGDQIVLNSINFSTDKGKILGFLGPNGAGKTTTMKIISGFTEADSGTVEVCGQDINEKPLSSKSKIGYLPEHNPLYLNMYVREYLGFIAKLHKLSNSQKVIDRLIGETGLSKEQNKKIKMLSKGYRQRVGLAQSLLHDPEVLILDEPTSGLDPNQLEDIRKLIAALGKEKTVVFSTHIMQEVQALCDKVIIINEGSIVADDKIDQLDKYLISDFDRVLVEFENTVDRSLFAKLPGFIDIKELDKKSFVIDCSSEMEMRRALFHLARDKNLALIGLQKQDHSVENIFQALTK